MKMGMRSESEIFEATIENLKNTKSLLRSQNQSMIYMIQNLESQRSDMWEMIDELSGKCQELSDDLNETNEELSELTQKYNKLASVLSEVLIDVYTSDDEDRWATIPIHRLTTVCDELGIKTH